MRAVCQFLLFCLLGWTCLSAQTAFAAGRQLTGQFAPTPTPALSPAEAQKAFHAPQGFEARLFAAEPDVINPVAMTWDARGRLWVLELYEYPLGAPPGSKGRDRVKILEDTDGDGRADKVTVFADGFNLATGLALGNGGVYVGQAPYLYFLRDTNHDDVADTREVVLSGFGLEDRHELLNSFTWGPDGQLYLTHGVFTQSKVRDPGQPNAPAVTMNAAVARFDPRTKKFEVVADGTSNPWGVDFDREGNAFVSACVIDHFFQMAPGGVYVRQGGVPTNPFTYELLPSIVDHKHFMAAYAGVDIYQGNQFPAEWRGEVFLGNIHQSAIHHDHLTPRGSSFVDSAREDFLTTTDGWFRPISTQTGPDGALWIMDWYDKYPCYQNAGADPEGVDRERGRIWRVVYVGDQPGKPVPSRPEATMDLARLNSDDLVRLLAHPNVWQRRMAQHLLTERRDPSTKPALLRLLNDGGTLEARLAAFWTLFSSGLLDDETLDRLVSDKEPAIRAWVARFTGERRDPSEPALARLETLARDADNPVRLGVATAAREFTSGSLTVDTPVSDALAGADVGRILAALVGQPNTATDPLLSFMIWTALEPKVAQDPALAFAWLREHGAETMPLSGQLVRKIMRRVCDTAEPAHLDEAVGFIGDIASGDAGLEIAALDGLIEGQRGKALLPTVATAPVLGKLAASGKAELAARAQELGALWGDASAVQGALTLAANPQASLAERVQAIQVVRQLKTDVTRNAMLALVAGDRSERIVLEALRALGEIGGDHVADDVLKQWPKLTPATRRAAAEVLVSRGRWAGTLLAGVENKTVVSTDIPTTAIRTLAESKDAGVRERTARDIGRFRESSADKLKLIGEKKRMVLNGPVDLEAGHELAKKTCFVCHRLYGEGADVGPDLTGVGRSTLDALLANVIDPNQVIGKGYENVEVETRDGRSVSGRLVEDTTTHVKLLSAGPKEDVVARSEIASIRVSEISVMPEGLEQMPDADFRNLVWFVMNPPQDHRPLSPELRYREVNGRKVLFASPTERSSSALDGESEALSKMKP
ncbi:MAG: PVC-type heme-binding CxxCH protein [Limisphaerales bacterium]